ncbi:MAG: acyl-CoA thioesterase [Pseudomonadota bacterium]
MMAETLPAPVFSATYDVSFGDCDPAGIVFYPHMFAWLDRTFHGYLKAAGGGHAAVCEALNAKGTGLISADCQFRRPVTDGDDLVVDITAIDWHERTYKVAYEGRVKGAVAFEGTETRALFVEKEGRMTAGDVSPLKARLQRGKDG